MEITNISKCHKPYHSGTFKGSENEQGKVRYKHFEQLSDDVLSVRSILKAHKEVENSNKMRAFKAIPTLTTALIGTSIAIAQPGKLSKKMSAGLGFLMLSKGIDLAADAFVKLKNNKKAEKTEVENFNKEGKSKKALKIFGAATLIAGATIGLIKGKDSIKKFVSKEAAQLSEEINTSKVATFVEEKITPFMAKHPKIASSFGFAVPLGIIGASSLAQIKLSDSLSKDLKEKAEFNFAKGKEIQKIAREHFDTIDAIEV